MISGRSEGTIMKSEGSLRWKRVDLINYGLARSAEFLFPDSVLFLLRCPDHLRQPVEVHRLPIQDGSPLFSPTEKAGAIWARASTTCAGTFAPPRSKGSAKRSLRPISCFTLYAIQCLRGLGNREWMRLRSYELPVTAALCFRSDIFIQPRRQWNGHSSGCNCQAISPQLSQSDCHPLLYPLQSRERLP